MQALDKYQPFKSTGDDFADSNPIFSYYFYEFYLDAAVGICKNVDDPVEQAEIKGNIAQVEGLMKKMQGSSKMAIDKHQHLPDMLEYTELMFAKNEHQFQQEFRSKQMAEVTLALFRTSSPSTASTRSSSTSTASTSSRTSAGSSPRSDSST